MVLPQRPRNGPRLRERLKQTPCPHCKVVGTLIRHGFLYGFDESNPQRKTVRARRIFCSNRHARRGCGRTFSVWFADKIRRLSLTTGASVAVPPRAPSPAASSPPSAPPTAISVTGPGSASGNGSTWAKARSARHCRGAARRPNCRLEPAHRPAARKSSPISRPPSPTPTVPSPPSNMRCAPSSCKPVPSSHSDTHTVTHPWHARPSIRHPGRQEIVGLATSEHDSSGHTSMPIVTELSAHFAGRLPRAKSTPNSQQRKMS